MSNRLRSTGPALLLVALICVAPVTACASMSASETKGEAIVLTDADSGKTRTVPVGSTVTVALPGNGGTGYGWSLDPAAGITLIDGPISTASATPLPGGPETETFHVKVAGKGQHVLRFHYSQPWQGGEKDAKIVSFTLIGS